MDRVTDRQMDPSRQNATRCACTSVLFVFLRQKRDQRQMTVGKTTQTASFISTYLPLYPVIDAQPP